MTDNSIVLPESLEKKKNKSGRPTKYNPEFHPQNLIELMSQGYLDCEIYAAWDIHKDTFYTWRNEHEDIAEAFAMGLPKCEAWWVGKMREYFLKGDDKGFKYCIAIMNNKFGWEKGAKQGEGNITNISINNMNVLQQMPREKLLEQVNGLLLKHQDILDVKLLGEDNESK